MFLLCCPDDAVIEAAATAKASLGVEPSPYMPHLSLLYSDIDADARAKVVQGLRQRFYGEDRGYGDLLVEPGFWARGATLWRTNPEDKTLESWVTIGDYDYKGSSS